nr:MAG TPA: hypothetical protein [Caudoviricetes sp.]
MLSLTEELTQSIAYQGREYPIDLSYDNVLRFYQLLDDADFDEGEKIIAAFHIFFDEEFPDDPDFLMNVFQLLGEYVSDSPYGGDTASSQDDQAPIRYFSFQQDAPAIYASFMEQYGIDLIEEQGRLHWDKFKALLDGLGPDTQFRRIVAIRQRTTDGLEGEELAALMEQQQYYRLTDGASVDAQTQRTDAMLDALFKQ